MNKNIVLKDYKDKSDIKYKDFVEFEKLIVDGWEDMDEAFLTNRILKIFYGLDLKTIRDLKQDQVEKLLEKALKVVGMPVSEFKNIILMNEVKYGFIPNFSDITAGELIDLEDCLAKGDFYSLTAILYRPIIGKVDKFGRYEIEPYNGYDDKFKDASLDIIEGYKSLFTKSFQILSQTIPLSTKQMNQEKMTMKEEK